MKRNQLKFNKISILHLILLGICILCIAIIFFWRHKTTIYHSINEEVYVDEIFEDKIVVKGLPYTTGNFNEEYIIRISDDLVIKDQGGGAIDSKDLERGDILLFDYVGPLKLDNGTLLNGEKTYACNFRLSDEKINLKLWRLE